MATSDLSETVGFSMHKLWLVAGVAISFGLVVTTALVPFDRPILRQFDLGIESNLASLWSGLMLLISALHAFDGYAAHRRHDRALAWAWLAFAAVLAALSLDEIGSLHERVELIADGLGGKLTLAIAAAFGIAMGYSLFILYRSREFAGNAKLISIAIALLVTVPLQEYIQDREEWPGYLDVLRIVIEEGTEIVAIVLFFLASIGNTKGLLGSPRGKSYPTFEAIVDLRLFLLIVGPIAAVGFAWIGPTLSPVATYSQSGMPTAWLAGAFYCVSALAFARPWLSRGESLGWQAWTLVAISLFACATTVISPEARMVFVFQVLFAGLLIALSALDSRRTVASYLPVALVSGAVLAVDWLLRGDQVLDALLVEVLALAFFFVASAPQSQRSGDSARLVA